MLPWKLRRRQILLVNQNLSSVYFSPAKFQLVSCNLSLAMMWQMTCAHKLPKLCSATLSHSKYDTVTPPAFKYKSCKIRIIFKGAVSRFLLDLFKKLKRVVPSITWEKQYASLFLAIETIFRCLGSYVWQGWTWIETFQVSMLRQLKITKIILLWLVLPWWYLFHNSRGVFLVMGKGWWGNDFSSEWTCHGNILVTFHLPLP